MRALLRRLACPWTVSVQWESLDASHRAATFAEALDWASQYPADSVVVIRHRWSGIRAVRFAV